MQSVALSKLGIAMHKDAADMFNEAAQLEEKRQRTAKASLRIKYCAIPFVIGEQYVADCLHGTRYTHACILGYHRDGRSTFLCTTVSIFSTLIYLNTLYCL